MVGKTKSCKRSASPAVQRNRVHIPQVIVREFLQRAAMLVAVERGCVSIFLPTLSPFERCGATFG